MLIAIRWIVLPFAFVPVLVFGILYIPEAFSLFYDECEIVRHDSGYMIFGQCISWVYIVMHTVLPLNAFSTIVLAYVIAPVSKFKVARNTYVFWAVLFLGATLILITKESISTQDKFGMILYYLVLIIPTLLAGSLGLLACKRIDKKR